jgi:hypothetical protein
MLAVVWRLAACPSVIRRRTSRQPRARRAVGLVGGSLLLLAITPVAASADLAPGSWVLGGHVDAAAVTPDATFLGSSTGVVSRRTGGGIVVDPASGGIPAAADFPRVVGTVTSATPDGAGGWYVAGSFSTVAGAGRPGLARVRRDGTLDPDWVPAVRATSASRLVVAGGAVVVSGADGEAGLVALDPASGATRRRLAAADGDIKDLVVDGAIVRVGGTFSTVDGLPRRGAAAVDAVSGAVTPWDPGIDGGVSAMAQVGTRVYLAGGFSSVGGVPRSGLAAVAADTGSATSWDPRTTGSVRTIEASEDAVAVTGNFSEIGGARRYGAAVVDTDTGRATAWDHGQPTGNTSRMGIARGTVYYATGSRIGDLATVTRSYDARTGEESRFHLRTNGPVETIEVSSSGRLYVGGRFSGAGPVLLDAGVVRVRPDGSVDTEFSRGIHGTVGAMAIDSSTLYLAEGITEVNGEARRGGAAIDLRTGRTTGWDPQLSFARERAMAVTGGTALLVSQQPGSSGLHNTYLRAFDAETGALREWHLGLGPSDPEVTGVVAAHGRFLVRGTFRSIGGVPADGYASIDASTGAVTGVAAPEPVTAFDVRDGVAYAAGRTAIGVSDPQRPGGFALTHRLRGFEAGEERDVGPTGIAVMGDRAFVSGPFSSASGAERSGLAGLDLATGVPTDWVPGGPVDVPNGDQFEYLALPGPGRVLAAGQGRVVVGGSMLGVDSRVTGGAAILTIPATPDPPADRVGPDVVFSDVPDGASTGVGYDPKPTFRCVDPSGVDTCDGEDAAASEPDPVHPGFSDLVHTFTVTARDLAGNVSRHHVTWRIPGWSPVRFVAVPPGAYGPGGATPKPPAGGTSRTTGPAVATVLRGVLSRAARDLKPLLRARGATVRMTLPTSGRVTVTVTASVRRRPVVVARAARTVRAGTVRLRVAPTGPGRRVLSGRRSLRVSLRATFTPTRGTTVRRSTALTLRR